MFTYKVESTMNMLAVRALPLNRQAMNAEIFVCIRQLGERVEAMCVSFLFRRNCCYVHEQACSYECN